MANKELADGQPPKKKSKFKWFLLFLFFLILLGAGAAGAWIFLLDGTLPDFLQRRDSAPAPAPAAAGAPAGPVGNTVALPVFVVNLADPLGQRFIQLSLEAEVANEQVTQNLQRNMARIRDSIIMLLSSKSYADVATTESKILLKGEITDRMNGILGPGKVYQVFITDMKVQ